MSKDKLTNLTLLTIEDEYADNFNFNEFLNKLAEVKLGNSNVTLSIIYL